MKINKITAALSVALLGTAISAPTYAAEGEKISGLEVIQVTATKRTTTTQQTPLTIEAMTGEELARENIAGLSELSARIPSVQIGEGLTAGSINVRGMGSGQERGFEQSVAMFIDEVYMPRSRQYRAPFFDAERVEVMRGPQAVLFGLNATAGTIQVHSASTAPGDDSFVKLTGTYEAEYEKVRTDVVAGTTIGDFGVRIAYRHSDQDKGYYENEGLMSKEDGYGAYGNENTNTEDLVRATVVWDASSDFTLTAKVNYIDAEESGEQGEFIAYPDMVNGGYIEEDADWTRSFSGVSLDKTGRSPGLVQEALNFSLKGDYQLGNDSLSFVIGQSSFEMDQAVTTLPIAVPTSTVFPILVGVPYPDVLPDAGLLASSFVKETYDQSSVEVKYSSDYTKDFSYIVGLYVASSELTSEFGTISGTLFNAAVDPSPATWYGESVLESQLDSTTLSPFFSGTYNINDDLRVIAGVRYSSEDKEFEYARQYCNDYTFDGSLLSTVEDRGLMPDMPGGPVCGGPDVKLGDTFTNVMPELIVQWDMNNDNSIGYAKIGQSVKAGGYSMSRPASGNDDDRKLDEEVATAVELGLKSRLFDGNLEINVAAFRTEFEDLQLNAFVTVEGNDIPQAQATNAGEAVSQGVEIELNYLMTDWLVVGGSIGLLDSTFENFANGPCNSLSTPQEDGTCDLSGESTPFAPEYSGSIYADLEIAVGDNLMFSSGVTMSFSDSYFTDGTLNPLGEQDSYQRFDARIALSDDDDVWSVAIIGNNLSDEAVINLSQELPVGGPTIVGGGTTAYISAPKTVTLQGTYNF
ncbi:TonB-dependent receptor [Thalassotalea psychrophila]|uniref:TonB-dependent receptor n=1 Tax=Thalassotalea psychrophila TaxID=3065647 RepID=A0ABY9TYS4_9GAMM|nr:TonB-dependent receptor [Colwelliaceae bacterium SQ149]